MRHTNGPWFCDGNFVRHVDTSKLIAEVYISPTSQNGNIMADSRLIASAPDLLEALYSALDLIKNELGYGIVTDEIQAAIAKAKGISK